MEPPQKIRHVDPVYPPSMVASRTEGTVVVKAVIASSGCVVGAHVVQGQSVALDLAAVRAVVDWRFRPTTIDSKPISVALLTTVRFSLQ